jgi:N-acyl-D-aspartate/D-glutamate deacylase
MTRYVLREVMALDDGGTFGGPCDVAVENGVVAAVGRHQAKG